MRGFDDDEDERRQVTRALGFLRDPSQRFIRFGAFGEGPSKVGLDAEFTATRAGGLYDPHLEEAGGQRPASYESGLSVYFARPTADGTGWCLEDPARNRASYHLGSGYMKHMAKVLARAICAGEVYLVKGRLIEVPGFAYDRDADEDVPTGLPTYDVGSDGEPVIEDAEIVTRLDFWGNEPGLPKLYYPAVPNDPYYLRYRTELRDYLGWRSRDELVQLLSGSKGVDPCERYGPEGETEVNPRVKRSLRNPTYYHGTREEHIDDIESKGLMYPFLSSEPSQAWCWGRSYSSDYPEHNDVRVLEVEIPDEDMDDVVPDYNLMEPDERHEILGVRPEDYFDVRSEFHRRRWLKNRARKAGIDSVPDRECGGDASIFLGRVPPKRLRRVDREGRPIDKAGKLIEENPRRAKRLNHNPGDSASIEPVLSEELWRTVEDTLPDHSVELPARVGKINGVEIWLVDPLVIWDRCYTDFNYGGHDLVYGAGNTTYPEVDFIPPRQIWLDGLVAKPSMVATLYHEVIERTLMEEQGLDYEHAHEIANASNVAAQRMFARGDRHA